MYESPILKTSFLYLVGFLISQRIMNIPPQISVPLYETLFNDISKAEARNLPFRFTHYLLICRCLIPVDGNGGGETCNGGSSNGQGNGHRDEQGKGQGSPVVYYNPEEEALEEECDQVLQVDKSKLLQHENGANVFDFSESEYESAFKILILDARKSERIVSILRNLFPC